MAAEREHIRFLVFAATTRDGSLNRRLAELAAETIVAKGGEVDLRAMSDFDGFGHLFLT